MWCCATSERCFVALAAASVTASNVATCNLHSRRLIILERNMEPAGPLQLLFGKDGLRTHCPTRDAEPRQLLDRTQPSPHHLSDQQCNICSDTDKKLQQNCEKTAKKLRKTAKNCEKNCECNISTETRKLQKNCEKTAKNCGKTARATFLSIEAQKLQKNCEKTAKNCKKTAKSCEKKLRVQHFHKNCACNISSDKNVTMCRAPKVAKKLQKNCEKTAKKLRKKLRNVSGKRCTTSDSSRVFRNKCETRRL